MENAKVLVVDDSITMRALFSDVLERTRGIRVVGAARDASEARELISELKPNILTLDVEMPGMNGLDFLEEIMSTQPLPVVMLSTLTKKGAESSMRAFELGAVECFPKPQHATPAEFDKIADKLGKLVLAAANGKISAPKKDRASTFVGDFKWNGRLVAFNASTGGIEAIQEVLSGFPANCPPTIAVMRIEPGFAELLVTKLSASIAPKVVLATDGMPLAQGTVYIAADPAAHVVVDAWPNGHIRFLDKEPVQGFKPSASLLYASMAKTGASTLCVVMTGIGDDGAAGLRAIKAAGGTTMVQDAETAMVQEAPLAAVATGAVDTVVPLSKVAEAVLNSCSS
jgi:two-component system, chemotaxis family, protein-glutamate methylesterase/glutaminase